MEQSGSNRLPEERRIPSRGVSNLASYAKQQVPSERVAKNPTCKTLGLVN